MLSKCLLSKELSHLCIQFESIWVSGEIATVRGLVPMHKSVTIVYSDSHFLFLFLSLFGLGMVFHGRVSLFSPAVLEPPL